MNGNGVVTSEVERDIKELEEASGIKNVVKYSLIRALTVALSASKSAKHNRILLYLILAFTVKGDVLMLIGKIAALMK